MYARIILIKMKNNCFGDLILQIRLINTMFAQLIKNIIYDSNTNTNSQVEQSIHVVQHQSFPSNGSNFGVMYEFNNEEIKSRFIINARQSQEFARLKKMKEQIIN